MTLQTSIKTALDTMIFSASGWRGVFVLNGSEESTETEISQSHTVIVRAAAKVFAELLINLQKKPTVLLAIDTRPTGPAIAQAMIPVLAALGCKVRYAGICAAPEIMAWARTGVTGFIYVSASHNPIGHNGLKFGLNDGGVLPAQEAVKLIDAFRSLVDKEDFIADIENLTHSIDSAEKIYSAEADEKSQAFAAYYQFCGETAWGGSDVMCKVVKSGIEKNPLSLICDFNGSARTVSIDKKFFTSLGLGFDSINSLPGQIAHRIVPEGESLTPCRELLENAHRRDASFIAGYVPDCDGDRGNLVIWDNDRARALEAQEVFALSCLAEFSHLVWTGELFYDNKGKPAVKAAVAVNDPTSLRIDRIAETFGIEVFRAEVGEANVVGLARRLREQGYLVRILGEGSAGGNITHPSAVRDPVNTVLGIVKLLTVRSNNKQGLFEIWCNRSGQAYRNDFNLSNIIASLPPFYTTASYAKEAVLTITIQDHGKFKDSYQKIFLREWEERKASLKVKYGIYNWEALAYNGMEERKNLNRFGDAGKGGLKINFSDAQDKVIAAIWMRGSATEPVFRIMADSQDAQCERELLEWQSRMTLEAQS